MVRLPNNKSTLLNKPHRVSGQFEQKYERKPSVDELAECLEIESGLVKDVMNSEIACNPVSETFKQDDGFAQVDLLGSNMPDPDTEMMYESIKTEIELAMHVLDKRNREILILYFGLGKFSKLSLEEIGERFNITKEHAARLKTKTLDELRNCSQAFNLMSDLS